MEVHSTLSWTNMNVKRKKITYIVCVIMKTQKWRDVTILSAYTGQCHFCDPEQDV